MSQFQDLSELLDPRLPLPIRGKTYYINSPSVKVGLKAQAIVALAGKVKLEQRVTPEEIASLDLDDDEEREFTQSMLGPAFAEMEEDELPWEYVRHAAKTVFMWVVSDRADAATVWANLGNDPRPVPQDRKAPAKRGGTKKATSKSSSTSRKTPGSRGTTSSTTGS